MTQQMMGATETTLVTPGLDGSNPLGFLAALGLLRALDLQHRTPGLEQPRLSWTLDGHWQAVFHGVGSVEQVVGAVMEDKREWTDDPALLLAYNDAGDLVDPKAAARCTRDLKPSPAAMRAFVLGAAERANSVAPNTAGRIRRSLDLAAAYGSEVIQDNNGNTKPTAFHFTAGQQRFLDAIARLHEGVSEEDLREALLGPWSGNSTLPSMSWDATVSRNYALRSSDPSKEKRGSNPGADWLAFIGLSFTASFPNGRRLATTGVVGGWKDSVFTWPLWTAPLSACLIRAVLAMRDLRSMPADVRRARGIGSVMAASIVRSDQGGYGSFTPSAVV